MPNTLLAGMPAPEVKGKDAAGNEISLSDFRGSKVVLYFYPEDDTPLCTLEACDLRDNYQILLAKGLKVIGISPDTEESHQAFIEKYSLPFPLVADVEKEIALAYGTWGEKNMYGRIYEGQYRITFLIDEEGVISHVIKKPKSREHSAQILKLLGMS
ncbi:MAG: thioredoxin-dependent thiol peroxidase [Bacteroidia bacterium]